MRVLLLGGGHAHALLLHRLASHPLPPPAAVTVVSPTPTTPYSGALPGWMEGVLTASDANIDIQALATAAGATFVGGVAASLNPLSSTASLAASGGGEVSCLPYDALSINVGGGAVVPPPGADAAGAVSMRPLAGAAERLAPLLSRVDAAAAAATAAATTPTPPPPLPILVVGGGAAGCEVAAALASRGRRGVRVTLAAGSTLLPDAPPAGCSLVARELEAVDVAIDTSGPVVEFVREGDGDRVLALTSRGTTLTATRGAIVLALPAAAPAWLASTGLSLDAAGFLATDARGACTLAGGGKPPAPTFAVGDCASVPTAPTPKAGVHAVRAVPLLEAAVRACVAGGEAPPPPPPRPAAALALLSLGRGRAVALRPGWPPVAGRWVLAWKRWLDGRHVRRLGGGR